MTQGTKTFVKALVVVFASIFLIGCKYDKSSNDGYRVDFFSNDTVATDSVGLYVWDDVYGKNRLLHKAKIEGNHAIFTGIIDKDRIAYIRPDSISGKITYFVLTNDCICVDLRHNIPILKGGKSNDKYSEYLKKRQDIRHKMQGIFLSYLKVAADSSLTLIEEENAVKDYKYWNDSLQILYSEVLNESTLIKDIFVAQFGNEVDSVIFNLR